jgi:hypothetical protein
MPHDERHLWAGERTLRDLQIRSAKTTSSDLHKHLTGTRFRYWDFLELEWFSEPL